MVNKFAVLPCNGLDKVHGQIARDIAMEMHDKDGCEIICPVLIHNSPPRYKSILEKMDLCVIDGCATRCASKLANELNLKISKKILVSEEIKSKGYKPEGSLRLSDGDMEFSRQLAKVIFEPVANIEELETSGFEAPVEYVSFTHDKYIFRIPLEGYYFIENDSWVRVEGNRARVGVSDYVQKNVSDITFFDPPMIGIEIAQFDEAGTIESLKTTVDVIAPVSGKIIAVNTRAADSPELINDSPYEEGWLYEIELIDFESDKDLLTGCSEYLDIVKKKTAEFNG